MDDTWQLVEGLAGPLIVMPPGQAFNAATDHIVMVTSGPDHPFGDRVYVNSSLTPEPIALHAGVPQRLRLIKMTTVSTDIVVSLQARRTAVGRRSPKTASTSIRACSRRARRRRS